MAWNDNNNQNPWGYDGQTPPELDQVIIDFKKKFNGVFGGNHRQILTPQDYLQQVALNMFSF